MRAGQLSREAQWSYQSTGFGFETASKLVLNSIFCVYCICIKVQIHICFLSPSVQKLLNLFVATGWLVVFFEALTGFVSHSIFGLS